MPANSRLSENVNMAWAIEPKNWTGAASTGVYFSLKNYGHITFVIQTGAWAGGTAAVTLTQSTDVSATGEKALAFTKYWIKTSASDLPTETAVTSNTFNLSAANKLIIIEVDATSLDVDNGFDVVCLKVATPGANNDFYGAVALLSNPAHARATNLTAIAD